jgi:hypothetical protein
MELSYLTLCTCTRKMTLTKQKETGRFITQNELAHNLMLAFISEICFILLPFKTRCPVFQNLQKLYRMCLYMSLIRKGISCIENIFMSKQIVEKEGTQFRNSYSLYWLWKSIWPSRQSKIVGNTKRRRIHTSYHETNLKLCIKTHKLLSRYTHWTE